MPIYDVGYREWLDDKISRWSRCFIIAQTGIRITLKSVWVKRVTMACWLPIFYWGVGFLVFERLNDQRLFDRVDGLPSVESTAASDVAESLMGEIANQRRELIQQRTANELERNFSAFPSIDRLAEGLRNTDPGQVRHTFWSWMLMTYFRYPQAAGLVFLLGFVTPSLISKDVRSRALVLYFSRPIGRLEYLLGKFLVPTGFLMAITTAPALVLYILGVFLSPSFEVVWWTWDIPLRIFLATAVVVLPTVSLALMLSAMTQESRFAAFAWFAIWALGHGAWFAIQISALAQNNVNAELQSRLQAFSRVSLYNILGEAQTWVFGFSSFSEAWVSLLILALLTFGCQILLFRRLFSLR
jgi:ABC-2 type transport system permease protein